MSAATTMSPRTGVQVTPSPTMLRCLKTVAVSHIDGLACIAMQVTPTWQTIRRQSWPSYIGGSITVTPHAGLGATLPLMRQAFVGIHLSVEPLRAELLSTNSLPRHPSRTSTRDYSSLLI